MIVPPKDYTDNELEGYLLNDETSNIKIITKNLITSIFQKYQKKIK